MTDDKTRPRPPVAPRRPLRSTAILTLTASVLAASAVGVTSASAQPDQVRAGGATAGATAALGPRQVENLDRGLISNRVGDANFLSWRLLASDPDGVTFTVYRDGVRVTAEPVGVTNFLDRGAPAGATYTVQYEFVVKWDPSNAKDNSQSGVTGNVYVDAYKLNGTRLWRIDLGRNIRAGAHYTQFQVYDYDGDGQAEVAMKTADATVDGTGKVIGNASADHRNSSGYILSGPEYLTMFNGRTGAAMSTVDYVPARGTVANWGDSYGNRVDRFLAATAYLDGSRPSLIEARGYYTRSVISAWDFRNGTLTRRWTFDSNSSTNGKAWEGQGNHNLSVADVDDDGRDEIVYGAMAVDDNGYGLWNTGMGHGDAMHVGDLIPSRPGLEEFKVDEDASKPGSWMADARTGQILWRTDSGGDNGRGVSGDIYAGSAGAESWSARDGSLRNTSGAAIGRKPSSINFLVWWDGDAVRELLDDTHIDKYGTSGDTRLLTGSGVASNNGTKATPALSADILGDWREEVVWRTSNSSALRIYSTTDATSISLPSLMQDPQYRVAVAWQNTAYNQPPHPSYFIGAGMAAVARPNVYVR